MIKAGAKLSIQRIPLECLQVKMYESRHVERLLSYISAVRQHPQSDILLHVAPSNTHPGMYCILDGYHRFCASIMAGRKDALCVVIEEEAAK